MFYKTSENHGLPHNPFKSCVVPRPIAWVSTIQPNGAANLAPFSFFNAVAEDPPMVMISFNGYHQNGGEKDSLHNIKTTREFVVNMVTFDLRNAMNITSAQVDSEVNEFELASLQTEPSVLVKPPRVALAPIHLECLFHQEIELPSTREDSINRAVIGRVIGVHINDEVLSDGMVDLTKVQPLARLGYRQYCSVDHVFELTRPE